MRQFRKKFENKIFEKAIDSANINIKNLRKQII